MDVKVNGVRTPFGDDYKSLTSTLVLLQSDSYWLQDEDGIKENLKEIILLLRDGFSKEKEDWVEKRSGLIDKASKKSCSKKIRELSYLHKKLGDYLGYLRKKLDKEQIVQMVYNLSLSIEGLGIYRR